MIKVPFKTSIFAFSKELDVIISLYALSLRTIKSLEPLSLKQMIKGSKQNKNKQVFTRNKSGKVSLGKETN